jgi:DedD protein
LSQAREQESMKVMVFISLLLAAGLIFGAGVMVGVNLAKEEKPAEKKESSRPPAEEPPQQMVFPEVLEGQKAPEQLKVKPAPVVEEPSLERPPPAKKPPAPPAVAQKPAAGEEKPPQQAPTPPTGEKTGALPWSLQVAAYRESEPAEKLAGKLRAAGYQNVEVVKSEVAGKGTYYRVRLGRYPEREASEADRQRLAREMALDALPVRRE